MKKRLFILIAITAGLFWSCSKEDGVEIVLEDEGSKGLVFSASTEPSTKTALQKEGDTYNVVWQNGDEITIVDASSKVGIYSTTSTSTTGSFTFSSGTEVETAPYMAYYPAAMYDAGTVTFPATQNYVEGNVSGAPMYAESETERLQFKNIGGIIRLNISTTQSGKKIRKIMLAADQGMSGAIANAATLASDSYVATVSGTASVALDCGEDGVEIGTTAKPFQIAVPQNSYSSLSITVIATDGDFQVRTAKKNIVVNRSSITDITLAFNDMAAISGLVHHWPFNGDTKDVVGGVDAAVGGATPTTDRFGNANGAYYLDGYDQMSIGQAGNFGTSSFTANLWVNTTQPAWGGANLIRTDGGGGGTGWFVRFVNYGKLEIWTSGIGYTSPTTYADGSWHMVTFVRDAEKSEGRLYVDGVYIGGFTGEARNVTNSYNHYFGSYGGGEFYEGKMDDVRMYDKALSAEEISALYAQADDVIDLSASATANTYIVSEAGKYKFKATVKGNGGLDPLTGAAATTIDPSTIAGVKVLWEVYEQGRAIKHDGTDYDVSYSDGYVYFSTPDTFTPGDACVAVYDSDNNILWSWVIWATPEPGTMIHNGATFMDRNLGAINVGNCMRGFLFQWGRKDAFSAANGGYSTYTYVPAASTLFGTTVTTAQSMAYAIQHPTVRICHDNSWMLEAERVTSPWRDAVKTIYDPCPAGWRVPTKDNMDSFPDLPDTGMYDCEYTSYDGFGNPGIGYYATSTISDDPSLPENAWSFCNDGRNLKNWAQATGRAIRPVRE